MKDYLEFINTHPNLMDFLMGLACTAKGEDKRQPGRCKPFPACDTCETRQYPPFFGITR